MLTYGIIGDLSTKLIQIVSATQLNEPINIYIYFLSCLKIFLIF